MYLQEGPPGLKIVWRSGYPNSGFFQDYSVAADIVEEEFSLVTSDTCPALQYRSTLSIMLRNEDNGLMYVCAARDDNDPELVANITLSISAAGIRFSFTLVSVAASNSRDKPSRIVYQQDGYQPLQSGTTSSDHPQISQKAPVMDATRPLTQFISDVGAIAEAWGDESRFVG
ncbi:hypothetical protein RRG08_025558 [Elysia crispata]|uniref:Uncharacterized protein n=1 Tax=Elysia crispata TaxID=231223 RepID=A0AAE0ZGR1_9GAST|nr:hypothetical protein RRG08_025558 [Elysia crispata]